MHVHVAGADGLAKFWLEPVVALESHYGLNAAELRSLHGIVQEREDDLKDAWRRHFSL